MEWLVLAAGVSPCDLISTGHLVPTSVLPFSAHAWPTVYALHVYVLQVGDPSKFTWHLLYIFSRRHPKIDGFFFFFSLARVFHFFLLGKHVAIYYKKEDTYCMEHVASTYPTP